jgi:hypothetical protein
VTTKRNSPGVDTEAVEIQAGELNTPSVTENLAASPKSADLPPLPSNAYNPGFENALKWWSQGFAARQPQIDRLTDECNRLYLLANNTPEQVAQIKKRRLDGHFERESARFFASFEVTR